MVAETKVRGGDQDKSPHCWLGNKKKGLNNAAPEMKKSRKLIPT